MAFILAMAREPDVQKRAQAEIDGVLGGDRLPTFADKELLPYVTCVVWESLRWNPVTPFGLAHCVIEDDVYRGYRIPKGTTVIPNVWCDPPPTPLPLRADRCLCCRAILHEPTCYPDPLRFDPSRFEDAERNRVAGINPLPEQAFGFGRRICPGRHLALEEVWLTIVSMLAVYEISPVKDEDGKPLVPPPDFTSTSLR